MTTTATRKSTLSSTARKQTRRESGREWVHDLVSEYNKTGDIRCAWDAITICLRVRLAFPPEIHKYLLEFATDVTRLYRERVPRGNGDRSIDRALASLFTLERGKKRNPLAALQDAKRAHAIAALVYLKRLNTGWKWTSVWNDVAESQNVSFGTVKAIWYKHKALYLTDRLNKPRSF